MAEENCPPPLLLSASGAMDGGNFAPSALPIRIETSSLHSSPPLSSPATSTPSLEQQKSGEIREEKTAAGKVLGYANASGDLLGVPHVAGVVSGRPQPHTSREVHGETLGGRDFRRKKSRNKANMSAPIGVYGEQSGAGDFLLSLKAISQTSIRRTDRQNTHWTNSVIGSYLKNPATAIGWTFVLVVSLHARKDRATTVPPLTLA